MRNENIEDVVDGGAGLSVLSCSTGRISDEGAFGSLVLNGVRDGKEPLIVSRVPLVERAAKDDP